MHPSPEISSLRAVSESTAVDGPCCVDARASLSHT